MIERALIGGRLASVAYYGAMLKIIFDDGEIAFAAPADEPDRGKAADAFNPDEPRDESGKWTAGAGHASVPDEPGKAAIPEGRERRFHYTPAGNVEGIRREGIKLNRSQGRQFGDPVAVWSNPDNPYPHGIPQGQALVEYHDDPKAHEANPYASPEDVPPENIVAIHEPWHEHYRYAKQEGLHPQDLRDAGGEDYAKAAAALEAMPETGMKPAEPEAFVKARDASKRPQYLSPHPASELVGHTLLTNKEGTVGISVDPHGDIQNVFNNGGPKGGAAKAMVAAIAAGGRTLDCYDGYLPGYYSQFGFKEDSRMKFNPDFAPPGWDFDKNGMPDIVFMSWSGHMGDGGAQGVLDRVATHHGKWPAPERSEVYGDDWDAAKQASRAAAADARGTLSDRDAATVGEGTGPAPADGTGDQPESGAGEGDRGTVEPEDEDWTGESVEKALSEREDVIASGPEYMGEGAAGLLGPSGTVYNFSEGQSHADMRHEVGVTDFGELGLPRIYATPGDMLGVDIRTPLTQAQRDFLIDAAKYGKFSRFVVEGSEDVDVDAKTGTLTPGEVRAALKGLKKPTAADSFDPAEPRDETGKWTAGGGAPPKVHTASTAQWKEITIEYPMKDGEPLKWPGRVIVNPAKSQVEQMLGNDYTAPFQAVQMGRDQNGDVVAWNAPHTMNIGALPALAKAGHVIQSPEQINRTPKEGQHGLKDVPEGWFAMEESPEEQAEREKEEAERKALFERIAREEREKTEAKAKTEAAITSKPAFKKWFGKSKVVDDKGVPLRAYHGTTLNFNRFKTDIKKPGARKPGSAYSGELGAFFAAPSLRPGNYDEGNAESVAGQFAGENIGGDPEYDEGANIMPVYLSIKNPKEFDAFEDLLEERDEEHGGNAHKMRKALIKDGYDGVVIRNSDTDGFTDRDDWVAFYPEQIKSASGNRGTFDPNSAVITDSQLFWAIDFDESQHPRGQPGNKGEFAKAPGGNSEKTSESKAPAKQGEYVPPPKATSTPPFKRWFGKSQIVDEDGEPQVLYHGTMGDFSKFSRSHTNPEGNWGGGFYFTNDPEDLSHNYAGRGPDITNKIYNLTDQIEQEMSESDEGEGDVAAQQRKEGAKALRDRARAEAEKQLGVENEGAGMPVYLRMEKPFKVGGKDETFLDYDLPYDEEGDEFGEPTGKVQELIDALRKMGDSGDYFDNEGIKEFADEVQQEAMDSGGIQASKLEDMARKSEKLAYVTDTEGKLVSTEILRKALEQIGFDGIIDTRVSKKFERMGLTPETTHYIVFDPHQIKSASGNRGTFDPGSEVITDSDIVPTRELEFAPLPQ